MALMTLLPLSPRRKMLSRRILTACAFGGIAGVIGGAIAAPAEAGLIVLSGDATITEYLVGEGTSPIIDTGNQRFFDNLLGSGNRVLVLPGSGNSAQAHLFQYYGAKPGVTVTFQNGDLTSESLSGVSLYVSDLPFFAYNSAELALLSAFSSGGGSILLLGEGADGGPTRALQIANINALLTNLGSSLRLGNDALDGGIQTLSSSRILPSPLTSGVTSFTYAFTNTVTGGTGLFTTSTGQNFVAAENIGGVAAAAPEPGSLFLLAGSAFPLAALIARRRGRHPA